MKTREFLLLIGFLCLVVLSGCKNDSIEDGNSPEMETTSEHVVDIEKTIINEK